MTAAVTTEAAELVVPHASAWRDWLTHHHGEQAGVWLVLARKGTSQPTSLTYDEALEEAICHGWIDGQVQRRDKATYRQRFTPRRPRSRWSERNVAIAQRLTGERRMHQAGLREVERAMNDGRWQAAYAGPAGALVPADLVEALAANTAARAMFEVLTSQNRYAILHRLASARREATRARLLETFVAMLARGETIHPQRRSLTGDGRGLQGRAATIVGA